MRPLFCFLSCTVQHSPVTACLHLSKCSSVTSIKIWWNILELSQILSFLDCCSVFELLHKLLLVIVCQSDFLIFIPTLFRSSVLSSVSLCHVLLVGKMQWVQLSGSHSSFGKSAARMTQSHFHSAIQSYRSSDLHEKKKSLQATYTWSSVLIWCVPWLCAVLC